MDKVYDKCCGIDAQKLIVACFRKAQSRSYGTLCNNQRAS